MAEYRLDDLARISGVSARNIRAYRERGLLDPPRRVGRSAYYDDYHLSQLRTINQLLRRGFNSSHIAEFFTGLRRGADLADILGIQRAVLGPRVAEALDESPSARPEPTERPAVDIDADGDEARKLVEHGLAERIDGAVVPVNPTIGEIVGRTSDHLLYVHALLHIHEATRDAIDGLTGGFVRVLEDSLAARFRGNYVPQLGDIDELSRIVGDYRDLWSSVVSDALDSSVQQQIAKAVILLGGQREPNTK